MDRRNRLQTDAVEAVECLHHWLSNGLVDNVVKMLAMDRSSDWWNIDGLLERRNLDVDDV